MINIIKQFFCKHDFERYETKDIGRHGFRVCKKCKKFKKHWW